MKLGRLPAVRPAALSDLAVYAVGKLPAPPDWVHVPRARYPIDGNDAYGDCLDPSTRVLTADLRWVEAGTIEAGDELIGFDENVIGNARYLRRSVVERAETVEKHCYELELEDGTVIRASGDHQWLRRSRAAGDGSWLRTDQMVVGEKRASSLQRWISPWSANGISPYDQGYLAGALDGEGCLAHSSAGGTVKAVQFSQRSNVMLREVERILSAMNVAYGKQMHAASTLSDNGYEALRISGRPQVVHVLGKVRPKRLLERFAPEALGTLHTKPVRVVRKTDIGMQQVAALQTSTRTFIAEGFASHNCTIAGGAHMLAAWNAEVGEHDRIPGEQDVVSTYFQLTGGADSGLAEADVLKTWRTEGLFGEQIAAYAPVLSSSILALHQAVAFYGGCYLGIVCPLSAQQQFESHQEWTYIPGSPIEGGHCIVALGYDSHSLKCATWGGIASVNYQFLAHYLEEAWVVLPHQFIEAKKDALGIDLATLQADLAKV